MIISNLKLEEHLISSGKITQKQLDKVLKEYEVSDESIDEILVEKGYITKDEIIKILELQFGIPYVDLDIFNIKKDIVTQIPENISRRYDLIAIDKREDYILVAMTDPLNIFAIDDLEMSTEYKIKPVISAKESIQKNIDKYYRENITEETLREFVESYEITVSHEIEGEELLEVTRAPIVKLINSIIEQAIDMNASDIHIEPYKDVVRIRFRIDGDLHKIMVLSKDSFTSIITRIKIIGDMNIAEKRVPQDGRVEAKINGKEIDMRISTIPTIYGEKVVMRLLNRSNFMFTKAELGFTGKNLKVFNKILEQAYGMILVTGPTGSGKTTTLYATLKELNKIEKNIITIEDPVEYKLSGINQIQVNPKSGLTFASGLRSILRQDPDIIMVGEIRDSETADMAIRSAITGHLILSTLHTNDSPSSIIRLVDMGVEPYMISSAVIGIISQRLIKELCPRCKRAYEASYSEKQLLQLNTVDSIILYKAKGCSKCNSGYKGRRAIQEVMVINDDIKKLIDERAGIEDLRKAAIETGMITLLENSITLAIEGQTTIEEVIKAGYTLS